MPNNYGDNPPLSYNKYLRVQDLINLQDCLSTPAHHDELLFITVHQAYELWFKQILHEIDAAIQLLEEDRVPAATRALKRVVDIEKLLVTQIHILESMSPISFLAFRATIFGREFLSCAAASTLPGSAKHFGRRSSATKKGLRSSHSSRTRSFDSFRRSV